MFGGWERAFLFAMNQSDRRWLSKHFGGDVLFDEPMRRHTTFRIGGPADALLTVTSEEALRDVSLWARDKHHPIMILGAGSNLLVRDGGVRGLMIRLAGEFEEVQLMAGTNGGASAKAGAAVLIRALSKHALDQGLAGLNFALGIPGTVGGALRMNAGAWGACMADVTMSIRGLYRDGDIVSLPREELNFSYRKLELEKETIILSGQFRLVPTDPEALSEEAIQMQKKRRSSQPLSLPSAGCVFRNPPGSKAAGELIEAAGLKGVRVGDAEVSTTHANFIVNRGHAKASEVIGLITRIRQAVFEASGVDLEPEVTIIGEEKGT